MNKLSKSFEVLDRAALRAALSNVGLSTVGTSATFTQLIHMLDHSKLGRRLGVGIVVIHDLNHAHLGRDRLAVVRPDLNPGAFLKTLFESPCPRADRRFQIVVCTRLETDNPDGTQLSTGSTALSGLILQILVSAVLSPCSRSSIWLFSDNVDDLCDHVG
jgi:hypothetical protein